MFAAILSMCPVLVPMLAGVLLYAELTSGKVSKLFGGWE